MDMTLENIAKGEPMGVYGNEEEGGMFIGITLNNIMVSFNVFVSGVFDEFYVRLPFIPKWYHGRVF